MMNCKKICKYYFISFLSVINAGLLVPEDQDTLFFTEVIFEWEQIPNAINYNLQISNTPIFDELFMITDVNEPDLLFIEKNNIEWGSNYYWRVRPIYQNSLIGDWIDTLSFSTGLKLFNNDGILDTDIINADLIQNGYTIYGDPRRSQTIIFTHNGKEVWNSGNLNFTMKHIDNNLNLLGISYFEGNSDILPYGSLVELDLDGNILWGGPSSSLINPHDLKKLPNGNYLGFMDHTELGPIPLGYWTTQFQNVGYVADGITHEFPWLGYKIVEWDKDTNQEIWSWNVFDYFTFLDFDNYGDTWNNAIIDGFYDWTHVNAIHIDTSLNKLYVSDRNLSRVTLLNYPDGDIDWMMGLSDEYFFSGNEHICTELAFTWQHNIQKLDNGNLLLLDNGNLSMEVRDTDFSTTRILEFQLSDNNECEIIWSYELPENLFCSNRGSVQKLKNGNYLINTRGDYGHIFEITQNHEIVWDASLNNNLHEPYGTNYRAYRIPTLHPQAFSVIFENYMSFGNEDEYSGLVLDLEQPNLKFKIINKSEIEQSYDYILYDSNSWFSEISESITIDSSSSITLNVNANLNNNFNFNTLFLEVNQNNIVKEFEIPIVIVDSNNEIISTPIPDNYLLSNIYPNPFNTICNIAYQIPENANVSINVYNIRGQLIKNLFNGYQTPGEYSIAWDANNITGGVYFIKMNTESFSDIKKIIFLK